MGYNHFFKIISMDFDYHQLHTNQKLLIEALLKKGVKIKPLDLFEELFEIEYQGKKDFLLDRFSSVVPYHVVRMTADKFFVKHHWQKQNVATPIGQIFTSNTIDKALIFAQDLYPVVIKPNWGSHGDFVQVDLRSKAELKKAIEIFITSNPPNTPFILEQYFPWNEHRVFIDTSSQFAVVYRENTSVIGDGNLTLLELIEKENIRRLQLKKLKATSLCPIVVDEEVLQFLNKKIIPLDLKYIPKFKEKVFLRGESNLAKGGKAIDYTNHIHPSYIIKALEALKCFPNLPLAGLDLLALDPTQPATLDNHVFIEINSNPGLAMHIYPAEGSSQDVVSIVLKNMFPYLN